MNKKIIKSIFSVSGILIFAKILGLVKQVVLASSFGATLETDTINLGSALLDNLFFIISQAVLTSFIPIYISIKDSKTREKTTGDVIKSVLIITSLLVLIVCLIAPIYAKIVCSSYSAEEQSMVVRNTRLFIPLIVLGGITVGCNAVLRANEKYNIGEVTTVIQNACIIILTLILKDSIGVRVIIIASYVYYYINCVLMMLVSKCYWHTDRENPFRNSYVHDLYRLIFPMLVGYAVTFVNQFVDKSLSTNICEGAVTSLGYATV